MSLFIPSLQSALEQAAEQRTRQWWQDYLKGAIPFLGVGIPRIRTILKGLYKQYKVQGWNRQQKLDLAARLMEREQAEYKLAAILLYQIWYINEIDPETILFSLEKYYQKRLIADWNTGDWLCVRVLTPLLEQHSSVVLSHLDEWIQHAYVWKARAALVALCQARDITRFRQQLFKYCDILIRRPERFARTAAGWALRQYSRHDMAQVQDFLLSHREYLSLEVFNNAAKYLDKGPKKDLKARLLPFTDRGLE